MTALIASGAPGETALNELYPASVDNLRLILDRHRAGLDLDLEPKTEPARFVVPFPEPAVNPMLPNQCRSLGSPPYAYVCEYRAPDPVP